MAVIFHDTFNRANAASLGTSDTGHVWSTESNRGISGNKAYTDSGFGGNGVSLGLSLPYVSQVTFSNIAAGENPVMVFWRQDSTMFVGVRATTSGYTIYAFNFDDGFITYATSTTAPANGDVITVTVDASKVATVYLNGTSSGNIIMTWTINVKYTSLDGVGLGGSGTGSLFDDYSVANSLSDLSAAPNVYNSSCAMQGVATISATSVLKQFSSVTAQGVATTTMAPTLRQFAAMTANGVASMTALGVRVQTSAMTSQGVATTSMTPNLIQLVSATMQGVAAMTANYGSVQAASVTMQGVSSAAFTPVLISSLSVSMGGVAIFTANSKLIFNVTSTIQGVSKMTLIEGKPIVVKTALKGIRELFVDLQGERKLNIVLQGKRDLFVTLRGDMVTATKQNFDMYAGESRIIDVPLQESDGGAIPLSGASVKWVLKKNKEAAELLQKTIGSGITLDADGFTLTLVKADTNTIAPGIYYHVAELTDALGNESIVLTGSVTIKSGGI